MEKTAASGYEPLSAYIQFTVGETGNVTLRSGPSDVRMTVVTDTDGLISYVLTIPNHRYASVSLRKTDNSGQPLTGAKFQLCKYGSSWETVSGYEEIDMTSSEVTLSDLPAGRYRLTELNAPEGYVILNNTVYFNISFDPSGAVTVTLTDEGGSCSNTNASASVEEGTVITVKNTPGAALPSTGGHGTFLYTFGGLLLLLTAAFVYCFRMRRRERGRPDGL